MKRAVIISALLLGTIVSAHAARDYEYDNLLNFRRTDDDLHADVAKCGGTDRTLIGKPPFNACMLHLGWKVNGYRHFHVHHDRWGNPCKSVGGGRVCSNLF